MANLEVSYESVTTAATRIRTTAGNITNQLEDLERRARAVAATWDGEAREAFNATQTGWNNDVKNLKTKLESIATALQNSTESYQSTDRRSANNLRM